jgi:hypothetical protein
VHPVHGDAVLDAHHPIPAPHRASGSSSQRYW